MTDVTLADRERERFALPVIRSFRVSGYGLYPGKRGEGLDFECQPGVSIIAGINGLGKTTLLTALFRALSGPVDWVKRRVGAPAGGTSIELGAWRDPRFFSNRVGDAAAKASISVDFLLGDRTIVITRTLANLKIQSLDVDGAPVTPDQQEYQRLVCEAAGLSKFDDFFLLLRYLVFFLEERSPLVWDPDAQADVLRVLFFDSSQAVTARKLFDEMQRKDSEYRNTRSQANRYQQRIGNAIQASDKSAELVSQVASLSTLVQAHEAKAEDLGRLIDQADAERREERLRLEHAKMRLVEVQQEYAHVERAHFAQIFPTAYDVASQLLVQSVTGGGCLVCGTMSDAAAVRVRAAATAHRCPLCDSAIEPSAVDHEGSKAPGVVSAKDLAAKRLQAVDAKLLEAQADVVGRTGAYEAAVGEFDQLERQSVDVQRELADSTNKLETLQAKLPADEAEVADWRRAFNALDADARRQRTALTALEVEFETVLSAGEVRVRAIANRVTHRFREFAKHFLAEDCDLEYRPDRRPVGEVTRRFEFPRFVVRMTSANSPENKLPRADATQVSESQREFLDLAFRMALMEVASNGSAMMLVLETPEASLDSVFVRRAGDLFGRFSRRGTGQNRIIATSNLTRGEMIGALLGAVASPGENPTDLPHYVPPEARLDRIVNLLEVAAENQALRDFRDEYETDLRVAVFPEESGPGTAPSATEPSKQ